MDMMIMSDKDYDGGDDVDDDDDDDNDDDDDTGLVLTSLPFSSMSWSSAISSSIPPDNNDLVMW